MASHTGVAGVGGVQQQQQQPRQRADILRRVNNGLILVLFVFYVRRGEGEQGCVSLMGVLCY
jgi:hypothetical protein